MSTWISNTNKLNCHYLKYCRCLFEDTFWLLTSEQHHCMRTNFHCAPRGTFFPGIVFLTHQAWGYYRFQRINSQVHFFISVESLLLYPWKYKQRSHSMIRCQVHSSCIRRMFGFCMYNEMEWQQGWFRSSCEEFSWLQFVDSQYLY